MVFNNPTTTSLNIAWTTVPQAVYYRLQYKHKDSTNWVNAFFNGSQNLPNPTYQLTNLTPNTTFQVRIASFCHPNVPAATQGYSAVAEGTTTATCDPPNNLAAGATSTSSIDLSWSTTTNATSYTIEYKMTSSSTWSSISTSSLAYTINGLSQNTSYNIRVKAACGATQTSGYSNEITVTTSISTGCDTPTGLAASNITNNSCLMTWNVATGAINYSLDYTPVSNPNGWITATPNSTSQMLDNLNANTTYQARIKTVCGGGASSSYSSIITFNTVTLTSNALTQQTPSQAIAAPYVTQQQVDNQINIAPNPTKGEFEVMFKLNEINNVLLTLTDVFGKVLYTEMLTLQEERISIDLQPYTAGLYFLQVQISTQQAIIVKKVIKN